jgi:hypothetical protein
LWQTSVAKTDSLKHYLYRIESPVSSIYGLLIGDGATS